MVTVVCSGCGHPLPGTEFCKTMKGVMRAFGIIRGHEKTCPAYADAYPEE